jgi:mannose-1-phosphate guanylyltransferase
MNRSAILLVGGMGTRLQPLTHKTPKPMLQVAGVPFTEHQIVKAREAGITEIVLATSFKAELFEPYFGDGSKFGIKMRYAVETQALGTGGAIRNAGDKLTGSGPVAIFNGDVLSGHDLAGQFEAHKANSADVTLYLTRVPDARAFGAVDLTSDGRVSAFNEKLEHPKTNIINAGCYIFNRAIIEEIPHGQVISVERETFPKLLARQARVFGFIDDSYWLDIGTPQALLKGSKDLISEVVYSQATPKSSGEFLALEGAKISLTARVANMSVIGRGAVIGDGAEVIGSIIGDGAQIGARAKLTNCFVSDGFQVPEALIADGNFFGF